MDRAQRSSKRKSAAELLGVAQGSDDDLAPSAAKKQQRGTPDRVRVWWPPTRDKSRTGFSGAFWPADIVARGKSHFTVRYDNEDEERVNCENIFPYDVPIEFGQEVEDLRVGEFVEVSNGSNTDPCAWLGCVSEIVGGSYVVKYPFHDAPDETIKKSLIRRARIWDGEDWKYIQPGLTWRDGEVASPKELNLFEEKQYFREFLGQGKDDGANGDNPSQPAKANKRKGLADGGDGKGGGSGDDGGGGRDEGMDNSAHEVHGSLAKERGQMGGMPASDTVIVRDGQLILQAAGHQLQRAPPLQLLPPFVQHPQQLQQLSMLLASQCRQQQQSQCQPSHPSAQQQQEESGTADLDVQASEQLVQRLLVSVSSSLATAPAFSPKPAEALVLSSTGLTLAPPVVKLPQQPAPASSAAPGGQPALLATTTACNPAAGAAPVSVEAPTPVQGGLQAPGQAPAAAGQAAAAAQPAAPARASSTAQLQGVPLPLALSDVLGVPSGTFAMGTVHCGDSRNGRGGELLVLAVPKAVPSAPATKSGSATSVAGAPHARVAPPSSSAPLVRHDSHPSGGAAPAGAASLPSPGVLAAALSAALAGTGGSGSPDAPPSSHIHHRKKDPLAPKKAVSAYQVYMSRHRAEIAEQNPGLGAQDSMKLLAHMWKSVPKEERDECEATAQRDRVRYQAQLSEYKSNKAVTEATLESLGLTGSLDPGQKKRRARDPGAPPKPVNAYILFQADYRKGLQASMNATDASKLCGEAWKAATLEVKAPYEQLAAREKERFVAAMAEYHVHKAAQAQKLAAALKAAIGHAAPPPHPKQEVQGRDQEDIMQDEDGNHCMRMVVEEPLVDQGSGQLPVGQPDPSQPVRTQQQQQQQQALPAAPHNASCAPSLAAAAAAAAQPRELHDILDSGLDLQAARAALSGLYSPRAYHMLLDVWRGGSARVRDAVRSWRANVAGQDKPDYQSFMIGIFGIRHMRSLELGNQPEQLPECLPHPCAAPPPGKRKRGRPRKHRSLLPQPVTQRDSSATSSDEAEPHGAVPAAPKRSSPPEAGSQAHSAGRKQQPGLALRLPTTLLKQEQQQQQSHSKRQFPFARWDDEDANLVRRPVTKRQRAMLERRISGARKRRSSDGSGEGSGSEGSGSSSEEGSGEEGSKGRPDESSDEDDAPRCLALIMTGERNGKPCRCCASVDGYCGLHAVMLAGHQAGNADAGTPGDTAQEMDAVGDDQQQPEQEQQQPEQAQQQPEQEQQQPEEEQQHPEQEQLDAAPGGTQLLAAATAFEAAPATQEVEPQNTLPEATCIVPPSAGDAACTPVTHQHIDDVTGGAAAPADEGGADPVCIPSPSVLHASPAAAPAAVTAVAAEIAEAAAVATAKGAAPALSEDLDMDLEVAALTEQQQQQQQRAVVAVAVAPSCAPVEVMPHDDKMEEDANDHQQAQKAEHEPQQHAQLLVEPRQEIERQEQQWKGQEQEQQDLALQGHEQEHLRVEHSATVEQQRGEAHGHGAVQQPEEVVVPQGHQEQQQQQQQQVGKGIEAPANRGPAACCSLPHSA